MYSCFYLWYTLAVQIRLLRGAISSCPSPIDCSRSDEARGIHLGGIGCTGHCHHRWTNWTPIHVLYLCIVVTSVPVLWFQIWQIVWNTLFRTMQRIEFWVADVFVNVFICDRFSISICLRSNSWMDSHIFLHNHYVTNKPWSLFFESILAG